MCTILLSSCPPTLVQAAPLLAEVPQETPPQPLVPETMFPAPVAPESIVPEQLEQAAPVDAPALTPQDLPVIISLESDQAFITSSGTATVTVTVRAEADLPTDKAMLTVTLPKGMVTSDGTKNRVQWPLPTLAAQETVVQQLQVTIDKVTGALKRGVGQFTATVDAPTFPRVETTLFLALAPTAPATEDIQDESGAVIASSDGEVVLLAAPSTARAGVVFRYTELYNAEVVSSTSSLTGSVTTADRVATTEPLTLTLAADVTTTTDLTTTTVTTTDRQPSDSAVGTLDKAAVGELVEPTPKQDHNLDAYRLWQFDALQNGEQIQRFDGEVLVQVSVKRFVKAGIDPTSLTLWTREGVEGRWTPVPTSYNAKQQRLQAWLPHFSQFGLGAGLQQSGDMLPSVKAFTVDQLNGGASVSIGLETPKGLGGMSPNLSLSYSSITMDDLFREAGSAEIEAQASSAGLGWHLGGVSYIARTDTKYDDDNPNTEKTFALVLNGTRVSIAWQDGKWRTNPEIFAKLDWSGTAGGSNTFKAYDFSGWTVWTGDGTKYEFGDAGPFPMAFSGSSPTATALERTYGNRTFRLAKRWYLRKVTDTLGNTMEYNYQGEQGWERGCVDDDWETAWQHWYTRAIDPASIYWSGQSGSYTLRALFSYTSRSDTYIKGNGENDCLQPLYGSNNKLTTVTVQVLNGGSWQTLRSYSLTQGNYAFAGGKNRAYLSTLDQLGKSSGLLQRYTFTYDFYNPNVVLLNAASTNFGGSMTFSYAGQRASCSNSTCPYGMNRYAVTQQITYDGLGNYRAVHHYYGPNTAGDEWSAVGSDGGFMGYKEVQSKYYIANSLSTELRREKLTSYSSGAAADRDNPDPRRGKLLRSEIWNQSSGGTLYQATDYDWKAYWLESGSWQSSPTSASWKVVGSNVVYPITWIRQEKATTTTGTAVDEKRYTYEGSYGNQTSVAEWANSALQRTTSTDYYPNATAWIVNKPARVRVYDSAGACKAEMRTVYDGNDGWYIWAPTQGLVRRIQQAISGCSGDGWLADSNTAWHTTYFEYDGYGNQTRATEFGNSSSQDITIYTSYDTPYHLFPIEQWYAASTLHKETATYYGVNGLGLSDSKAFWGAIQEHCGVNEVCTRQSYDQFGRRVYRWEAVAKGSSWAADSTAQLYWSYTPYGSGQTANTVLEWRNPRSEGNFIRKLYNGLGELIQEQRPYQNWAAGSGAQEIMVDYLYDALGRQSRVGTPWLTAKYSSGDLRRSAYWSGGYTETTYDPIDRPAVITAPNGEQQTYTYAGRAYSLIGTGRNGDPNKVLKWEERDGLGNLKYVRTYNPNGNSWTVDAQVTLTYDVLGNLTSVSHPNSIGTTTIGYDLGGRKTSMSDPDLGSWSYAYDRQGKLTRQTDARNATICLYYDSLARLAGKHFRNDTSCPASVANYNVFYWYDTAHSSTNRSRGQLTYISNGQTDRYLTYNDKGLLATERIGYADGAPYYYTSYGYDSYLRPTTITYPDNEVVTTSYNSMGLPNALYTSWWGSIPLIDSVSYDEAGRLRLLRYTQGTTSTGDDIWRTQVYQPWNSSNSYSPNGWTMTSNDRNGRLQYIAIGTQAGWGDRYGIEYQYDSFGNVKRSADWDTLTGSDNSFTYDAQNRLTAGYARPYSYDSSGRLASYEWTNYTSYRGHAVTHVSGTQRYLYDANGNMTTRWYGLSTQQNLAWDHENRLSGVSGASLPTESYLYDADGQRVRKTSNGVNTYYPNQYYEQSGSTITKYYYFNGQRVAIRTNALGGWAHYDLHGDHLGSTVFMTNQGLTYQTSEGYYAYGRNRTGNIPLTDHKFTGQKRDGTGLMYFNARYYDPELGQFLSPDTLVPDPTSVFGYNRYMYTSGNPMNRIDPSGHGDCPLSDAGDMADLGGDNVAVCAAGGSVQMGGGFSGGGAPPAEDGFVEIEETGQAFAKMPAQSGNTTSNQIGPTGGQNAISGIQSNSNAGIRGAAPGLGDSGGPTAGKGITQAQRAADLKTNQAANPRDNYWCTNCGYENTNPSHFHIDHIIPKSQGGNTESLNRRVLCVGCNTSSKENWPPNPGSDWATKHPEWDMRPD